MSAMIRGVKALLATVFLCGPALSCAPPAPGPVAISLVDSFDEATIDNRIEPDPVPAQIEWSFESGPETPIVGASGSTHGWTVIHDVENLRVREGRLAGTTGAVPIIAVAAPDDLDKNDRLHAIEIRLKVSAGTRLGVSFESDEELDTERIVKDAEVSTLSSLNAEIVAGDEMRTYTLTGRNSSFAPSFPFSRIRHILIRPSDVEGASFEIDSVDLVPLEEHLDSIPSGIGWHGLGDVYRETIVSRSPERLSFDVEVPSSGFLDLALGTIEEGPVSFTVAVSRPGGTGRVLLRRTLTTPRRWEEAPIDLDAFAGQKVTLTMGVDGGEDGTLGFWGSPTIRHRSAPPAMAASDDAHEALAGADPAPPQGVIVILADTLRRDHLQSYGYRRPTAPTLAGMAADGVLFQDAVAQGTWTKISVPSILTSLYPSSHGVTSIPDRISASVTTLAEAYRGAGYATFATSSVPFSGKLTNLHQGLDVLHERASVETDEAKGSKTARVFVDRLLPWLDTHRDVPFFVFLHVFDPHSPFEPRRPWDELWMDAGEIAEHRTHMEEIKDYIEEDFMKRQSLPTRDELEASEIPLEAYVAREKNWYDASIRAMDVEIERLLERLEELDLGRRTLVAFISDHGEEFLEHGRHFHGRHAYGEMLNVPLLLRWPGVLPEGLQVEQTVESIDLMPTLLQLSRLPVPEQAQGRSLLPLLTGNPPAALEWKNRGAFAERAIPDDTFRPEEEVASMAIIREGWKLIKNGKRPEGWPEFELYDHRRDPLNMNDVAGQNPQVVERLARRLESWHAQVMKERVQSPDEAEMSAEDLQHLRSLGYID